MFEHALIGIDGTSGGRDALALAEQIRPSEATLVHVWDRADGLVAVAVGARHPSQSARELLLEQQLQTVDGPRTAARGSFRFADGLREAEREFNADLLIIGSSGHFGETGMSEHVREALRGSPCALAVATAGFADDARPFERIGVAFDGRPSALAALSTASSIADEHCAELHAAEVLPFDPLRPRLDPLAAAHTIDNLSGSSARRFAELAERSDATAHVYDGDTRERLLAFSKSVDLLVIGSRGRGPVRSLILGSTTELILERAHCPVLVTTRA